MTATTSSMPAWPKRDAVRAATATGSPSSQRSMSTSWIECSISVPPPAAATSLRHVDPYMPWIGKYWSSRSVGRERPPVVARTRSARRRSRTRARSAARGRPDAARVRARRRPARSRRASGASGFSQKIGPRLRRPRIRPRRGAPAVHVQTHTTSTASTSSSSEDARLGAVVPRERVGARSGSMSKVAVTAASTSPASASCLSAYECTRPMWPQPTSPIRITISVSPRRSRRRRGGPRLVTEAFAYCVGRTLDRGASRSSCSCRGARRPHRARGPVATATVGSRVATTTRRAVGLRARASKPSSNARAVVDDERGEVGRFRAACATACVVSKSPKRIFSVTVRATSSAAAHADRGAIGEPHELALALGARVQIALERLLGADRLRRRGRARRRGRRRCGPALAGGGRATARARRRARLRRRRATSPIVRIAMRSSLLERRRPDAPQPRDRERVEERELGPRRRPRAGRRAWPGRSRAWRGTWSWPRRPTR